MKPNKTIYLIDGSGYIYRAYHAITRLSTSAGFPTNAIFGFTRMLIKLIEDRKPDYAVMMFDAKGPTFRHQMYDQYKANRPPMPEDLSAQIPYIHDVVRAFNIPVLMQPGYEADDLIGTLSKYSQKNGFDVIMVTGDKDFVQLVSEKAVIWDPMKDKTIDLDVVRSANQLEPAQIIDVMGLSGDTSDNIPGVPGIGPKTALSLIQEFASMENLYENLGRITKKKQLENLTNYKDQAFLSKALVTIEVNAPIAFDPASFKMESPDSQKLTRLFKDLEFKQLQKEFSLPADLSHKKYQAILDRDALLKLSQRLGQAKEFALDTETTSENPMQAKLVGLSFAITGHEAFYVPCGHTYLGAPQQIDLADIVSILKPVLENPEIGKIGQNIKYDWMVLSRHGIDLKGVTFDTMVASYLLDPSKRAHNLDQIALDYLDHQTIKFEDVVDKKDRVFGFAHVPLEKAVDYACEDADITLLAYHELAPRLLELNLKDLLEQVEMPLVPVLMEMERTGICVNKDKLIELSKSFAHQLERLEKDIYETAGERFNIKSSQQLGQILFEKLNLPVQKKTKKKTGYSTDVAVLTTLAQIHELPALILSHRTLAKLKSTYTDALLDLIDPGTGRIHTSYNQTVTATGRLSSSDPNLQNIPIRTEEGRQIREAFVPQKGWLMLSADYSQIELRILAHYSDDPILIKAFVEDEDIHTRTATEVFQVLPNFITPELRRQAKAINFGIIYGMSAFRLSNELSISRKMAQTYIDNYFNRYKNVKTFIDQTIGQVSQTQVASTLLGRIRKLPDINAKNKMIQQAAERTAVNTPIQGTAADLIKLAMIRVSKTLTQKGLRAAMLLTVHDELVFEVPPDEIDTVKALVTDIMENIHPLRVPLKVNLAVGENWAQAH